jgi:hypothetical protein
VGGLELNEPLGIPAHVMMGLERQLAVGAAHVPV